MADNIFNSILVDRPRSNTFDLSHTLNLSFNMGTLVPIAAIDYLPGDYFQIGNETLLRFAPLISPINSRVNVTIWWFACDNRILWDDPRDWDSFITEMQNPTVSWPQVTQIGGDNTGKLLDYIYGITVLSGTALPIDAHPIAAYTKIYDEWFINQNITTTESHIPLVSGTITGYRTILQGEPFKRTWEKDYFTSALPWAQKGDAVTLPLLEAGTADVQVSDQFTTGQFRDASSGAVISPGTNLAVESDTAGQMQINGGQDVFYDPAGTLSIDINAAAATINQLRAAYRLQEFLELDAMGGTRYTEKIYAHFGVRSPDGRMQRPEFLGRWTGRMAISEVLQTSSADATSAGRNTPLGTMAGHGISIVGGEPINFKATQHGWIIGIINVQPKPVYQQGLSRKFVRDEPLDYYWPKLAHIGEQEILNHELYLDSSAPKDVFGYTPRYAEYRYEQNRVAGEMRDTLSHWHLGRIFGSEPALNEDFIYCDPSPRIFNTLYEGGSEPEYSGDQIFGLVHNNIRVNRLMPKFGRPML